MLHQVVRQFFGRANVHVIWISRKVQLGIVYRVRAYVVSLREYHQQMANELAEVKGFKRACAIIESDLNALPPEAFDRCFGGKARTVADIMCEVNLVNDDVARSMRGEACVEWPEGWITAPEGQRTKEAVIAAFSASADAIKAQIDGYTEADLDRPVTTEHGETTIRERCRFMVLHMFYHSGQLNFIQTLLGDDVWHWG